jgi:hypothetical protein
VTVEFTSTQAWRESFHDILGIYFGDGSSYYPGNNSITNLLTTSDISGDEYTIRQYKIQHTYSAADIASNGGRFMAVSSDCCRIGSLVNAGGADEQILTRVDLNNGNQGSPVGTIPVVLQFSVGRNNMLAIAAADPDGDPISCRFAGPVESAIPDLARAGGNEIVISSGCVLSWNLLGTNSTNIGDKFAVQVMIEESNRCTGSDCGRVALDFIIELVQSNPPVCASDRPVNNSLFVNVPFTATFTGTDLDSGAALTSNSFGAPDGSSFTPTLGTTQASPASTRFDWTPAESDRGSAHSMLVTFQDQMGLQGICALSLQVSLFNPTVTCNQTNVLGDLFAMDGNAFAQRNFAISAAQTLFKYRGASKRELSDLKKEARKLYNDAWTTTWSISASILDCGDTIYCSDITTSPATVSYLNSIKRLNALTRSIIARIRSTGHGAKATSLRRNSDKKFLASSGSVTRIPAAQSLCPGVDVQVVPS